MKNKKTKKIKKIIAKMLLVILHAIAIFGVTFLALGIYKSKSIGKLLEVYMSSKYFVVGIAFIFILALILLFNTFRSNKRKILAGILAFTLILSSASLIYGSNYMMKIEKSVQGASTTSSNVDIVFVTTKESGIDELNNLKVGLLNNVENNAGYVAPQEYIKQKSGIDVDFTYKSWHELINALGEGAVDAIVLPSGYKKMLAEDTAYVKYKSDLKVIDKYTMKIEKENKAITDTNKPFNILLVGTDSPLNGSTEGYLFDVVIIATVDPLLGSVVLTSIPRDSTLYSPCIGGNDKITHNGSYGIECLQSTVEESFNTTIDYYMIIGFAGIIEIVEYLGGVYITNPYGDITMQNSSRQEGTVSIPAGRNLLDGQQTLAFARNRKASSTGVSIDANIRSSNHIVVLKAIIERIKEVGVANDINGLIDIVSKSTLTDFPINDLASMSQIATKILKSDIQIKTITLEGVGVNYPSPAMGGMSLYGYKPFQESVDYISKYIEMVYNRKFVFFDGSMNTSTGAPKEEPIVESYSQYSYSSYTAPAATPAVTTPSVPTAPTPTTPSGEGENTGGDGASTGQ